MLLLKYVICEDITPILFSAPLSHKDFKHLNPTSAGFVHVDGEIVHTYGESTTLGMVPHERDAKLIKKLLDAGSLS